jgi:uncharacterized protein YbjT (DUF2867 family)
VSDDVAAAVADVAMSKPVNGMVEVAGPEPIRMDELVRRYLTATRDERTVVADRGATYFGTPVNDESLMPGDRHRRGATLFADWLKRTAKAG